MDNHQTKHHSTYFNLRVTTTIKRTVMIGIQFHCYFCITILLEQFAELTQ